MKDASLLRNNRSRRLILSWTEHLSWRSSQSSSCTHKCSNRCTTSTLSPFMTTSSRCSLGLRKSTTISIVLVVLGSRWLELEHHVTEFLIAVFRGVKGTGWSHLLNCLAGVPFPSPPQWGHLSGNCSQWWSSFTPLPPSYCWHSFTSLSWTLEFLLYLSNLLGITFGLWGHLLSRVWF